MSDILVTANAVYTTGLLTGTYSHRSMKDVIKFTVLIICLRFHILSHRHVFKVIDWLLKSLDCFGLISFALNVRMMLCHCVVVM